MATSLNDFLHDELSKERVSEVVEAGAIDPVQLVEKHLFDGRVHLRRNASVALSFIGQLKVDNAHWVIVATKDSDALVRAQTIDALPALGLPLDETFDALAARLADPDASAAACARVALESLLQSDPEAMAELLVGHLTDLRPKVAVTCEELCAFVASEVAPRLVEAVVGDDLGLATAAKQTLSGLGTAVQTALIEGLPSRRGRFRLVALLDALPPASAKGRDLLQAYAGSEGDPDLVRVAERLLSLSPPEQAPGDPVYPSEAFAEAVASDKELKAFLKSGPHRPSLIRALGDPRDPLRANAAALLGLMDHDEASAQAVALLARDESALVRQSAARALGPLGASEALIVCLRDGDQEVVEAARQGLKTLPQGALAPLIKAAIRAPGRVADALLEVLPPRGGAITSGLSEVLSGASTFPERVLAAKLLGAQLPEPEACGALLAGLKDENTRVQRACVDGLKVLGEGATDATRGAVREAFEDAGDDALLRACSRALDAFDGRVPPPLALEALPLPSEAFAQERLEASALEALSEGVEVALLAELLLDGRVVVRLNSIALVACLGEGVEGATESLLLCLKDTEEEVRIATAEALGRVKPDASRVAPALVHARVGAKGALRQAIDDTLLAYGQDAVDPLIALMGARATVDEDALAALSTLGQPAAKALVALLTHDALALRVASARGLGAFGTKASKAAIGAVRAAFDAAQEPELLRACSAALDAMEGKTPPPAVLEERALPLDDFEVEALSEAALKKAASKMDVTRLGELLFDGRVACRVNAARSLGHLGKGAEAFVGALMVALKDSEASVREASAEALGRLKSAEEVVVPGLVRTAAHEGAEGVVEAAMAALEAFGGAAVPACIGLLSADARYAQVLGELARRSPKLYLKPLAGALEGAESPRVQENAAIALVCLGDQAASVSPLFLKVVAASDVPLKCILIRGLGKIAKPTEALAAALLEVAELDERDSVADAVASALRGLKRRA